MSNLLEINNLCVDYVSPNGLARAVNCANLSISKGETIGLAGESGCGKSTLAFAISRLHKAPALISEGEIIYNKKDVLKMNDKELRKFRWNDVSIVFQSAMNSLNPVITIGEQLTDVLQAHKDIPYKLAYEKGIELLNTVGMHGDRMESYPHQLSGGMRQRVVIAIALALEPKLIIMDEPTTALDVVVEREILNELYELKEKFGFSILFISHDLSLMGEIADRIAVMYAGNIVEIGTAEKVFSEPQHPYTKGLISSFPTIHGPKERLYGIPGNPVNLLDLPKGCNFQARCNECFSRCKESEPELVSASNGSYVSCHLI
ncbi:ABC transporter ATP-binding protein [Salinivibrio sp. EAGSL]|jgi:oligopeptide/dipeptide ABC transporter, ATP-binding protein, C-terminal domain|uniref:ABC transporter ATP-binding protein n=1 Tax=Salinivibrio sp. EAGSL TaxID=2738468 RepID=UPI0015896A31|nr:ABC transporter ATP-binding protein [Salinivibrio sp. EAGSL]NUY57361.1 ABC transporter ATP-binding protein [Salinivibrio sp. EAGSL]